MIIWHGKGTVPKVQCSSSVIAEIAELAMGGYHRYAWGGVEVGGVLFGKKESGTVLICASRTAECEHHYGPAFELSEKDCDAFQGLLSAAASDNELADLTPVGWYQSTSRRDLHLSEHARAFFQRFFPEPWQVAMLLKRSKGDPPSVAIFIRDSHGSVELHSPVQEFTPGILRQHKPPSTARE